MPSKVNVTFIIEDALPSRHVGPDLTPNLWALSISGGRCELGGEAVLSTATYPNIASFATGVAPVDHRIIVNRVWTGSEFVESHSVGPVGETIFDAAKLAGVSTAAVFGDHKLFGVMGAHAADFSWPPMGERQDVDLDEIRYANDQSVVHAYDEIDPADIDLTIVHFNDPDTASHLFGPDSPEARERFRLTDERLGDLIERLRARWSDSVVIVVSDHDQETVRGDGFDLAAVFEQRGLPGVIEPEGTSALVIDGPGVEMLVALEGVEGAIKIDSSATLLWGPEYQVFGTWFDSLHGAHGGPRCRAQTAVVGGGHPVVAQLATSLATRRPSAVDWAPTLAELCGFELPAATGRSLLDR